MKHNITPELAAAFIKRAAVWGFTVRQEENVQDDKVMLTAFRQGNEVCQFEAGGAMRYYPDNPLEAAFAVTGREIRAAVNALRSNGEPVCSDENGYYYAANEQELQHSVRQLESRIAKDAQSQLRLASQNSGLEQALTHYSNQSKEGEHGTCHI